MANKSSLLDLLALNNEQRNNRELSDRLVCNFLTLAGISKPHPKATQAFTILADRLTGNIDREDLRSDLPTQYENGEGVREHLESAFLVFDGFSYRYGKAHPEVHSAVFEHKQLLEAMESTAARIVRISCPNQAEGQQ